ncbi:MAG: DUF3365 domain-containing protein [bacterium]|nr:DUF3365 domain-containing protein [bacterium]
MNKFLIFVVFAALALLAACGSESQDAAEVETDRDSLNTALSADELLYLEASEKLIARFTKALQTELMSAMNQGGPVNAIGVCQVKAPGVAQANSAGGWSIRRVTDRFRNPDNRVDTLEAAILASFADTGSTAPEYLFDWFEGDSLRTFRFYKPIAVKPLCLKCHGGLQTLAPGVYQKLKKSYPLDRAIEYKAGDLRGMFVVEALWPEGKEQAGLLVNDLISDQPSDSAAPPDSTVSVDSQPVDQ